jgi:glycosyltransferase involved in cell wall biosynthesis
MLKDIEIICVNDGSTDNSLLILNGYAAQDSRIIIINQENQGPGVARNKGLEIAKAEYITFVDSDDWIELNTCEVFLNIMETENVDLVIGHLDVIDIEKEIDKTYMYERLEEIKNYYNKYKIKSGKYKFTGNFLQYRSAAWCKLYKKSIIDRYNFRFPKGLINEDEAWHWYYFSVIETLYFIDEPLYKRTIHKDTLMYNLTMKQEKIMDMVYILEIIRDYLIRNDLYTKYQSQYRDYFIVMVDVIISRCDKTCRKKVVARLEELAKNYHIIKEKRLSSRIFETILSIKNENIHKVICILGLKIKIRSKKLEHRILEKQK